MRRSQSMLAIGVLATVLAPGAARATYLPTPTATAAAIARTLFARCFGEAEDRVAAHFAAQGRELAESPLREHAFVVQVTRDDAPLTLVLPALSPATLAARYLDEIVAPSARPLAAPPLATVAPEDSAAPAPIALYRGVDPQPTGAPSMRRFDLRTGTSSRFVTFSPVLLPALGFDGGAGAPDAAAALPHAQAGVAVPMRVGHVRFETHAEAAQAQSSQLSLNDRALGAGATFDVRAGRRTFGVDLSSKFEHLTLQAPQFDASSFDRSANIGIGANQLPVFVPAYADVSKHTLSAGLAVPITRRLTASLQYDTQHLLGGYGVPGANNLDARNDIYGARVTFQLPKSASLLSLSAKQYRYQDNLTPTTFTQTSANVDFTIKF